MGRLLAHQTFPVRLAVDVEHRAEVSQEPRDELMRDGRLRLEAFSLDEFGDPVRLPRHGDLGVGVDHPAEQGRSGAWATDDEEERVDR
jgi:hypothetical protein